MANATYIQTNELTGTLRPSGAGSIIRDAQWGIDSTLSGFIIQDVSIQCSRMTDDTLDQKGALVSQLDYDERYDMTMTVVGGTGSEDPSATGLKIGDTSFTWDDKKWKVTGISYTGNYQSKKQYQITAFRTTNFPV